MNIVTVMAGLSTESFDALVRASPRSISKADLAAAKALRAGRARKHADELMSPTFTPVRKSGAQTAIEAAVAKAVERAMAGKPGATERKEEAMTAETVVQKVERGVRMGAIMDEMIDALVAKGHSRPRAAEIVAHHPLVSEGHRLEKALQGIHTEALDVGKLGGSGGGKFPTMSADDQQHHLNDGSGDRNADADSTALLNRLADAHQRRNPAATRDDAVMHAAKDPEFTKAYAADRDARMRKAMEMMN